MARYEYRVVVVGGSDDPRIFDGISDRNLADELVAMQREVPELVDIYVERRQILPWVRLSPAHPMEQPSLPL